MRIGPRRIARWIRVQWSSVTTPRDRLHLRHTVLEGRHLVVPANEDVGRQIVYRREYEPDETRFFQRTLRETDICFDVGANVGYYTVLMGGIARRGRVHAFEPEPLARAVLALNVVLNGLQNVVISPSAVGRIEGEACFSVARDRAYSGFADTGRRPMERVAAVAVTTLDDWARASRLDRVDVLKVDVEGAEGEVIAGGHALLQHPDRRPRLVMLELFDANHGAFGTSIEAIVDRMTQFGYSPFVVLGGRCEAYGRIHYNRHVNVFFSTIAPERLLEGGTR